MRGWLCLLLLVGCNPVFGLDGTDTDTDTDGDGSFDTADLCPAVADDQSDTDADGVGDACDICPANADHDQHDEDDDGQGDACDPCPAQQDFSDADGDLDGIGDACDPFTDPSSLPSRRLLFDPFVSLAAEWKPLDVPWDLAGDRVAPIAPLAATDGLLDTTLSLPATVDIDLGVISRDHWQPGEQFGIRLVDDNGVQQAACIVTCTDRSPACTLRTEVTGASPGYAITVFERVTLQLRLVIDATFPRSYCYVNNNALSSPAGGVPPAGSKIVLIASPNAQIASVDVVAHGE